MLAYKFMILQDDASNTYGLASVGIAPLRREPSDTAEMVSQILIGELFQLLKAQKNWWKVKALLGDYVGWINSNEGYLLKDSEIQEWVDANKNPDKRSPYYTFRAVAENNCCLLPPGCVINKQGSSIKYPFGMYKCNAEPQRILGADWLETATNFLGTPYLWGGRTDTGIDCSGFMQTVLMLHGIYFPRDSIDQAGAVQLQQTRTTDPVEPGDIIYFNPKTERISHVGFYLGDGLLLHASGKVKIEQISTDSFTNNGEFDIAYNKRLSEHIVGYQQQQNLNRMRSIKTLK